MIGSEDAPVGGDAGSAAGVDATGHVFKEHCVVEVFGCDATWSTGWLLVQPETITNETIAIMRIVAVASFM